MAVTLAIGAALSSLAVIRVHAPGGDFRRAGHCFGREPVELPAEALEGEQLVALVQEPRLVVEGSQDGETFTRIEAVDLPDELDDVPLLEGDERLQRLLQESEGEVARLTRELADARAQVEREIEHAARATRALLAEHDAAVATLTEQLAERDAKIAALQAAASTATTAEKAADEVTELATETGAEGSTEPDKSKGKKS